MTKEKKFEIAGPVAIVSTGRKEVKKEEFEKAIDAINIGAGSSLEEIYDHHMRLLYVIDQSGSMQDGIPVEESVSMYDWTPQILAKFRKKMKEELKNTSNPEDELDELAEEFGLEEDDLDFGEEDPDNFSDEELKQLIIQGDLSTKFGIPLYRNYSQGIVHRTKMQAVKEAAQEFVKARFKKYPDAKVGVYSFNSAPHLVSAPGASEPEVLASVNSLYVDGGTDIYRAVERAVNDCRRTKNDIGANHIVLVSDGLDGGAIQVKNLVDKMRELRVVFDFIFMQGGSSTDPNDPIIRALRDVCESTGGEFTIVKTEKDFQQKFLAASSRKCLPPAPAQLKS